MAEFVTVMKEFERMCSHSQCEECEIKGKREMGSCGEYVVRFPEEAEKIIMDWAAAHPAETMKDRLFKMFPDAQKKYAGVPVICPYWLGWGEESDCEIHKGKCDSCWSRPYEERGETK